MAVDLHIHSWHSSDSLSSPGAIVRRAAELHLSAIAITDHDTMVGYTQAREAADDTGGGVEVVPAVELSAQYAATGEAVHVIGLFVDPSDRELRGLMAHARQVERKNFRLVLEGLVERGVGLTEEDVRRSFAEDHPGVPWDEPRYFYLYRYLVKSGAAATEASARRVLQKVLAGKHSRIIPYGGFPEAIAAVKGAGGLAVLAHPESYSWSQEETRRILGRLIRAGLDGIEALHRSHSLEERARYAALARQRGLLISGGSDSHDPLTDPVFGRLGVPDSVLEEMRRRLGR